MPFAIRLLVLLPLLFNNWSDTGLADERLKGIACRSVHLAYGGREKLAFYSEVTVEQSAPGTYFMVCGWNTGYFGIQELADSKKLVIFSVWDNAQGDDPNAVDREQRVQVLGHDPAVRVKRFGGEGTGGQSFFDYDWQVGKTYRCMVTAEPSGNRTAYTGYFFVPEENKWKRLVSFSTITGGQSMRGFYAFVEDFKRDRVSTTKLRKAEFGNGWLLGPNGVWESIDKARFTADANPVENIDAGITAGRFFLATGGDTNNANTRLRDEMSLNAEGGRTVPEDVVKLLADEKQSAAKPGQ